MENDEKLNQLFRDEVKQEDGVLEVDPDATVSHSDDNGAYVQCWVWVADDQLPKGTFPECDECGDSNRSVKDENGDMLCEDCSQARRSA